MKRLVQSSWFVALAGCVLYLLTTAALLRPEQFAGARSNSEETDPVATTEASWKFRNPEFEQWIQELKEERRTLDAREQQLHEFQTRLYAEREEILSITQKVHQVQMEFDNAVVRFNEQQVENTKHQTKIIAGMSIDGAARMLSEMPRDHIVRILFELKTDQAASILDTLSKMGKEKLAAEAADRLRQVMPPDAKKPRSPSST